MAIAAGHTNWEMAQMFGANVRTINKWRVKLKCSPENPTLPIAPATKGFRIKGTSTLVDAAGNAQLQWIKTSEDARQRALAEEAALDALKSTLTPLPNAAPVISNAPDILNIYTITDAHVGMYAWAKETGEPWDLDIAERILVNTFLTMIRLAPDAKRCVINQLGDFLHYDGLEAKTPTSGHPLDADSRFQKMVWIGIRVLRTIIKAAMQKHEEVVVEVSEGNHDIGGSVWMRVLLAVLYENNPQVRVDLSPNPYLAVEHGKCMFLFHHGHLKKKDSLPLVAASQYPALWGRTEFRYSHSGHFHHEDIKEHPGMTCIQHKTLAAPDAHSARFAYKSIRAATMYSYHAMLGEVATATFLPIE